jgi:catechol-2,3-dioxygenase
MNRREFLRLAPAAAFQLAHDRLARGADDAAARTATARIMGLRLVTRRPLAEMRRFYHELLGLPILEDRPEALTVAPGASSITFAKASAEQGEPFYHFAFNIPENKILAAHDWQRERTPLDRLSHDLHDPAMPEDVVHFGHWNAHSIFFWDPAGNVVEYIARHDPRNAAEGGFGTRDILHASEIGFITDDVNETAGGMQRALGLGQYRSGDENFRALGDEHGLLLVIRTGRRWGYDQAAARPTTIFPTFAEIRGAEPGRFAVPGHPHEVAVREGRV